MHTRAGIAGEAGLEEGLSGCGRFVVCDDGTQFQAPSQSSVKSHRQK